jgi:hypothetical protein
MPSRVGAGLVAGLFEIETLLRQVSLDWRISEYSAPP